MTSIKQDRKEIIEKLKEKFNTEMGKNLTDQEILDICVEFSNSHLDEFIKENAKTSKLTREKIKRILSNARNDILYHGDRTDDELIYGI